MPYPNLIPHQTLVKNIADFFTSSTFDQAYFSEIDKHLLSQSYSSNKTYETFRKLGYLRQQDFMTCGSSGTPRKLWGDEGLTMHLFREVMDALVSVHLLNKIEAGAIGNSDALYKANDQALYLIRHDLLMNRLFGFEYIINQYQNAVFKIESWICGTPDVGNGFLVDYLGKPVVVTNEHVIRESDEIKLKDHSDTEVSYKQMMSSDKSDLAILELTSTPEDAKPFTLNTNLKVLTEVLTIGYPPVPTTKGSYAVFHLGEVNSKVESYWGHPLFLFSAKTNPANSGSSVIDGDGTILGSVTEQLEEQEGYKKEKLPYYAAIPSTQILGFLNETFH